MTPFVSVILAIRNEAHYIEDTLNAILTQDYPAGHMEIIIADGQSDDDTRAIVQRIQATDARIHMVNNPQRIVSTGLNLALRQASGEIIVRVDGHTIIAPDYLKQVVQALGRGQADAVGGRMCPQGENAIGKAVAAATSAPFAVGGSRFHFSETEEWVDTVYMGAWHRAFFNRMGGFDEDLVRNQDDEFNYRTRAKGGKVLLCPQIKSTYQVRSSLGALWRQYFQYGYWKVRVFQKHPRQMQWRHFLPPAFVLGLLASFLLLLTLNQGWLVFTLVAGSYLLLNSIASFLVARKNKKLAMTGLIFIVHAVLHTSYGVGFLGGLIKFINRWKDRQGKVPAI